MLDQMGLRTGGPLLQSQTTSFYSPRAPFPHSTNHFSFILNPVSVADLTEIDFQYRNATGLVLGSTDTGRHTKMPPLSAQSNAPQAPIRSLKRTFSSTLPASSWVVTKKMRKEPDTETRMPPSLPPVQSDTALAIFVHSSLKSLVQNERFGDADRLACLGQKVLHMAIAETLFEKRPMLDATDLIVSSPCTVHIVLI